MLGFTAVSMITGRRLDADPPPVPSRGAPFFVHYMLLVVSAHSTNFAKMFAKNEVTTFYEKCSAKNIVWCWRFFFGKNDFSVGSPEMKK